MVQSQKWPSAIFLFFQYINGDYIKLRNAKYFFLIFNGFRDIDVAKHTSWPPPTWPQKLKKPYFSKYTMDFNETFWRGWAFAKEDLVISIWFLIFIFFIFYHFSVFYKHTKKNMRADVRGSMTFILYKYIPCTISIWKNTHGTSHFSWDMEVGVWWSSGVMTKGALFQ